MMETEDGMDTGLSPPVIGAATPDTSTVSVTELRPGAFAPTEAPRCLKDGTVFRLPPDGNTAEQGIDHKETHRVT